MRRLFLDTLYKLFRFFKRLLNSWFWVFRSKCISLIIISTYRRYLVSCFIGGTCLRVLIPIYEVIRVILSLDDNVILSFCNFSWWFWATMNWGNTWKTVSVTFVDKYSLKNFLAVLNDITFFHNFLLWGSLWHIFDIILFILSVRLEVNLLVYQFLLLRFQTLSFIISINLQLIPKTVICSLLFDYFPLFFISYLIG